MAQKFMFVLYGEDYDPDAVSEETIATDMRQHEEFTAAVEAAGATIVGGEALRPVSTATTVRHTTDGAVVTDGPFLESKEVLGGFYLIEAADLDQALALAKLCPQDVEIRPTWDTSDL